jgi:cephalosporin hydroxylase
MLALLDYCDAVPQGAIVDPKKPQRRVLGIDIDIRAHNRKAIETHPLAGRIDMIEGSSIADEPVRKVGKTAANLPCILMCLDSCHTHNHVLAELEAYAPLVSKGSYCIVFDTIVEDLPAGAFPDRPWRPGDSPKTAVFAYLEKLKTLDIRGGNGQRLCSEVDEAAGRKLLLNATPDGFLKRL